jgi:hypothetical protein
MDSLYNTEFTRAERKTAHWEFWASFVSFALLLVVVDKLGYRYHGGLTIRLPRSWEELVWDLPYIVIIAFLVSVVFYFGELNVTSKKKRKQGGDDL